MSTETKPRFLKAWRLLAPEHRKRAVGLVFLMLIAMGLETLGIGLVVPALALMTEQDLGASYPVLVPILEFFNNPTRDQLVIAGMLLLAAVFVIKTFYLGLTTWLQARFVYGVQVDLAQRFFRGYLRSPYVFHLERNSAELIATANTETSVFATTGVKSGLQIVSEGLVLLGIGVLLLVLEPVGSLAVAAVLALAVWLFSRYTRERVERWGAERKRHFALQFQRLQEGLGAVKDVKILGRESDFLDQFFIHSEGAARAGVRHTTIQKLPRLWLEMLAVIGLATLVVTLVLLGRPLGALVPTLGLFAAAAFKMMPSVNRVLAGVQNVRYAASVVDTLYKEIQDFETADRAARRDTLPFTSELSLERVSFRYPNADAVALDRVSLSIDRGASVGLVGTSGAGKSTLINIILGLLEPDEGHVRVDGVDIRDNLGGWQDQIGYVPQSIFLSDDTLRRNVAFGLAEEDIDDRAIERALRAAQIDHFVDSLPEGWHTKVGERGVRLSGGQLQRIGVARALYHDPAVLVLDEATSSLDTATERGVMRAVRELKGEKTLLIVSHRFSTVEHCDRLFQVENGELVDEGEATVVLDGVDRGT